MAVESDRRADVVQQRRVVQELARLGLEQVLALESVIELERELGDVPWMRAVHLELLQEREHAAQPQVSDLVQSRDLGGVVFEVVGD